MFLLVVECPTTANRSDSFFITSTETDATSPVMIDEAQGGDNTPTIGTYNCGNSLLF